MKTSIVKFTKPLALCALSVIGAQQAQAEEAEWEFAAGLGVIYAEQPWLDADDVVSPFPMLRISYGNWNFLDNGLVSYNWLNEEDYSFYTGLGYRDDGYDADGILNQKTSDNIVFDGYRSPDRDTTIIVGGHWQYLSFSAERDISDHSEGLTMDLGVEVPIFDMGPRFGVNFEAGLHWMSEDYTQHIYGIEGDQIDVSKGRTAYKTDSALNYSAGFNAHYAYDENWILFGGYNYTKLDSEIADSPLVGDDALHSVYAGVMYRF